MDLKKCALGMELGSTRIKAVLLDEHHTPVASGSFDWENQLVNGIWTYSMDLIHKGVQACYADLKQDVEKKFGTKLTTVGAMEFRLKASEDREAAWADYLRLCQVGGSKSYLETLAYANLSVPFEPGTVERACGFARGELLGTEA